MWIFSTFALCLAAILAGLLVVTVDGFIAIPHHLTACAVFRSSLRATQSAEDEFPTIQLPENAVTEESTFVITKEIEIKRGRRWPPRRLLQKIKGDSESSSLPSTLNYSYRYDKFLLPPVFKEATNSTTSPTSTVGVVLVHPIGVGIARWFYERLLNALSSSDMAKRSDRLLIVSPDLLGSGSACDPSISTSDQSIPKYLPLLNISDWTDQLIDLMVKLEASTRAGDSVDRWCIVANGGCSPIALQIAAKSLNPACELKKPVSNVIISSSPRLPFFLNSSDSSKVAKAYARLCGVVGRLFWWYACRKEGKFLQRFSEKNLVANPESLGDTWRSNCYRTAVSRGGKSRYSTFAFLAGTLQDGCRQSLDKLKRKANIKIDIIKGRDVRRNSARSWFWQKPSSKRKDSDAPIKESSTHPHKTFRDLVEENGNGGREIVIGGRISLAHEDPEGYCNAMLCFLER